MDELGESEEVPARVKRSPSRRPSRRRGGEFGPMDYFLILVTATAIALFSMNSDESSSPPPPSPSPSILDQSRRAGEMLGLDYDYPGPTKTPTASPERQIDSDKK